MFQAFKKDKDSRARLGLFTTAPARWRRVLVATQAAVKGMTGKDLDEIGITGLLMNLITVLGPTREEKRLEDCIIS